MLASIPLSCSQTLAGLCLSKHVHNMHATGGVLWSNSQVATPLQPACAALASTPTPFHARRGTRLGNLYVDKIYVHIIVRGHARRLAARGDLHQGRGRRARRGRRGGRRALHRHRLHRHRRGPGPGSQPRNSSFHDSRQHASLHPAFLAPPNFCNLVRALPCRASRSPVAMAAHVAQFPGRPA